MYLTFDIWLMFGYFICYYLLFTEPRGSISPKRTILVVINFYYIPCDSLTGLFETFGKWSLCTLNGELVWNRSCSWVANVREFSNFPRRDILMVNRFVTLQCKIVYFFGNRSLGRYFVVKGYYPTKSTNRDLPQAMLIPQ